MKGDDMVQELFFKIYEVRIVMKHSNLDHTGVNDLHEYLKAAKGKTSSPQDKLDWVFDVFDVEKKESVDAQEMGDIIISLFNMSSIKIDEKKLLIHLKDMLNNHEEGGLMEIDRSEFIRQAVSCFFISDLVNASVYSKICSVPQIPAEDITVLAKKTKLSKKEIISQYKDFIAKYPSGEMVRKHFVRQKYEKLTTDANSLF